MIRTVPLPRLDARAPVVALVAVVCGVATATSQPAVAVATAGVALASLCLEWRRAVVMLACLLPFSGVPIFLAGTSGQAFRDVAVVLPLYVAFAFAAMRAGDRLVPDLGIGMAALAAFAALVLVHTVHAPSMTVAAIGTKVWLAYIPMLAVGYRYVRHIDDFTQALKLTALIGMIPAGIAVAECLIASRAPHAADPALLTNDFGAFRYLYGDWYGHVAGSVVSFYRPGGHVFVIARVPSTFTSSTQYFAFSIVAFAAGLSMALRTGRPFWVCCAAILAAGCVASGARLSYVVLPAVTMLSLVLAGSTKRQAALVMLGAATIGAAGIVAGVDVIGLARLLPGHIQQQLATATHEMTSALGSGLIGHGTGWDTNSALRYGRAPSRRYIENWYAKAALEIGIAGLLALVVAVASIHWRLWSSLRALDIDTRRAAAPVVAALAVLTLALFKGPYIDLDPLNVYFWLLAGMLLALPRAGRRASTVTEEERVA